MGASKNGCGAIRISLEETGIMVRLEQNCLPHRAAVLALVGLAALRLSLPAFAQTAAPLADVELGPAQQRSLDDILGRKGYMLRCQVASFTLGNLRYGIRYAICQNMADGGKMAPTEGYIGMPFPSSGQLVPWRLPVHRAQRSGHRHARP